MARVPGRQVVTAQRKRVPAVEGWFTLDEAAPALLGVRCVACETVVFPPRSGACPNPRCRGTELESHPLGRRGRIWSFSTNHYPPPEPYVAPDPFVPYTVAAVELAEERLVVLGQMAADVEPSELAVGDEVELTLGTLFTDDDTEYVTWQWRPVAAVTA
jgi:uncharacterized OB-fold protein